MATDIEILRREQLKNARQPAEWIWDGLIGPRCLTLFTSVCKLGKTTLVSHLLAERKTGGLFLGRAVRPGPSVVISEEHAALWEERDVQLGFRADDCFICRPFAVAPAPEQWDQLIDRTHALRQSDGVDLVVIDPLAHFLPVGAENLAALMIRSLLPLRRLTDAGMAVVLVHHPRKAASQAGLASRGCTILPGFADIIMEMYPGVPGKIDDRQRRLLSFSRFPATPRSLLFERSEDGRAFQPIDEPPPVDEFTNNWRILRIVLEDAQRELTRQEILEQWPTTYPAPRPRTLWQWLNSAFEQGLVRIEGDGRRTDPFRYYLPEKMEEWEKDPIYRMMRISEQDGSEIQAKLGGCGFDNRRVAR